jgi:hypothetical protein
MSPPLLSPHKRWVVKQMLYRELLAELDRHFKAMAVTYLPVKGAYLILAGLAEKIDSREMLDVDIIVSAKDFGRVRDYFAVCGQATLETDGWYFEQRVWYCLAGQRFLVEIHFLLNRPERFRLPTAELFARSLQKGDRLRLPSPEDGLAIAVCHGLVHIAWSGLRPGIFDDIAVIAGQSGFSWERFEAIMAGTGISRFMHFLFLLYERQRGPCPYPRLKRPFGLRLLAVLFGARYGRMPMALQRLLFEIPFVADPWGMMGVHRKEARRRKSVTPAVL